MSTILAMILAGLQLVAVGWLVQRWPWPFAVLGYGVGMVLIYMVVSIMQSPYLGEIHFVALLCGVVGLGFVLLVAALRGNPFHQSVGVVLFLGGMAAPVSWAASWIRDSMLRKYYQSSPGVPPSAEAMMRAGQIGSQFDAFIRSFVVIWLAFVLIGMVVLRLRESGETLPPVT